MNSFINTNNDLGEPKAKKIKKTSSDDPDDSFKLFKTLKPRTTRSRKDPGPSSSSSPANAATSFINESSSKPQTPKTKPRAKASKRKPKSAQVDIRKVLSKQEQMFNHIVTESCLEEGVDPEEMQIALAISESLKDQTNQQDSEASTSSNKFDNPFTSLGKVQPISAVLERFGFKSKKNYSEYEIDLITSSKFAKRSKFQKFPTALTRTSNEKRNEIIRMKIDRVLAQSLSKTSVIPDADTRSNYKVFSFYLQDISEQTRTVFMISSDDKPADDTLLNYYVTELFDPSFVKAGHMLKDWSKIPGRDSTPERTVLNSEKISDPTELDNEAEFFTTSEIDDQVIPDAGDDAEESHKATATSCLDIFADLEDFDDFDGDNESEVVNINIKENSAELADHLSLLQERLSQSMMEANDMEADDNEANENKVSLAGKTTQNDEPSVDELIEPENSALMKTFEVDQVDLTQQDSSIDSCVTIPYDDSYYSLQQHMKKLEGVRESPLASQSSQATEIASPEISVIQIDLVSSEDEKDEPLPVFEAAGNVSEDELFASDVEEPMLSQNSLDDDFIAISDEEINYSVRKFLNNNENPSDTSSEAGTSEKNTVDLTQELSEPEAVYSQIEINNHVEQSFVEVMNHQDAFNINDSILNLLETSTMPPNLDVSKKDRSTKFLESNGLSESIQEIMRKYGGGASNEMENSRSLKKMQSESKLSSESCKARKSVRFSIEDDYNVVDLTQPIEGDDSSKENSFQLNKFNSSIHQSIENIVSVSPIVPRKKIQRQEKLNFRAKKSLGVQIDDDYIVDTESIISEPDYKNMTPVELKQALFKYGIRSLPVKKAVKLLEYIFDQLHPSIRVAADEEIDVNDSRREMNITDIVTNIGEQDDDAFVFQLGLVDDEDFVLPKMRKSKVRFRTFFGHYRFNTFC